MMEKWTVMKARNSASSLPVIEALSRWALVSPPRQTRREPRTESASPLRPSPPPPSPRKQRRADEHDDSGDDGAVENTSTIASTKMSL